MDTTLERAQDWAEAEFGSADLGDERRTARLTRVAAAVMQEPRGALHGSLPKWAELIAAYRLLNNSAVTFERVSEPHQRRTRQECSQPGEFLLIEDTTTLDYLGHPATRGLGYTADGRGRGMFLHTTLALHVEKWKNNGMPEVAVAGVFAQHCWARTHPPLGTDREKRRLRRQRRRESERWAAAFRSTGGPKRGAIWTLITDREGDIYEVYETCKACGMDFIVRACQPRALEGQEGSVFEAVGHSAPLGELKLKLRARPGQPKRTTHLKLRAVTVTLAGPYRPGGRRPPLQVNLVEAREIGAPAGVEPLHWVLLTSWPIRTFQNVLRVVRAYTRRWLVEEYHKALKSGAKVEESQLRTAHSLQALIGILAVVAVRLLNMKLLARAQPDKPVAPSALGAEAWAILNIIVGKPQEGWTQRTLIIAIARLGGFLARKSDGLPGWQSVWRGWDQLLVMSKGFRLAKAAQKCV